MAFNSRYPVQFDTEFYNQLKRIGPDYSLNDHALREVIYITSPDDSLMVDLKNEYVDLQSNDKFTRPIPVMTRAQRLAITDTLPTGAMSFETYTYPSNPPVPYGFNIYAQTTEGIPRAIRDPNAIYITSLEDLPAPVLVGAIYEITLAPWTNYIFKSGVSLYIGNPMQDTNINIPDRAWLYNPRIFIWGSFVFKGDCTIDVGNITYMKTTGALMTCDPTPGVLHSGDVIRFQRSQLFCAYSGASIQIFNMTTSDPSVIFILDNTILAGNSGIPNRLCKLGTFNVIGIIINVVRCYYFSDGLTFNNIYAGMSVSRVEFKFSSNQAGCIYISCNGITDQINLDFIYANPSSNDYVFYFNPALIFNAITVDNSPVALTGSGVTKANIFAPMSLNQKTLKVKFVGNTFIPDSTISIIASFYNGAQTTVVDAQYQYVIPKDGIAPWTNDQIERMERTGNLFKYIGRENEVALKCSGLISLEPSLPVNKLLSCQWLKVASAQYSYTVDIGANTIIYATHGLLSGQVLLFSGILAAPIRADALYYVVNPLLNTFQISFTSGGAAIDITTLGGAQSYQLVQLLVGSSSNRISGGAPQTISTQAVATMDTNDLLCIAVQNMDDAVDIITRSIYQSVFK